MKTLKLKRQDQGNFDIVLTGGKWSVLESENRIQYQEIVEQRIIKGLLSQKNLFEPDFGAGIQAFLGTKKNLIDVNTSIRILLTFYLRVNEYSGDLSMSYLNSTVQDAAIYITILTKRGYSKRLKFVKENK